jgi:NADPH-dependent curcumin reductase CurA
MVWQHEEKYGDEFYEKVPHLIANGDIQLREQIYEGLEEAPRAVYEVQKGLNTGKAIVLLAED